MCILDQRIWTSGIMVGFLRAGLDRLREAPSPNRSLNGYERMAGTRVSMSSLGNAHLVDV